MKEENQPRAVVSGVVIYRRGFRTALRKREYSTDVPYCSRLFVEDPTGRLERAVRWRAEVGFTHLLTYVVCVCKVGLIKPFVRSGDEACLLVKSVLTNFGTCD
jgi:hypothetical protein